MTDGRHALAEEASLALHALVALRIRADPAVLDRARRRVEEWLRDGSVARVYADAWRQVLSRPVDDVVRVLEDRGERARQLRQTSPFAGAIDPRTRWKVWRESRAGAKAAGASRAADRGRLHLVTLPRAGGLRPPPRSPSAARSCSRY